MTQFGADAGSIYHFLMSGQTCGAGFISAVSALDWRSGAAALRHFLERPPLHWRA